MPYSDPYSADREILRESLGIYRALHTAAKDFIFILNTDGSIADMNETAAERLGKVKNELIGNNIFALLPPEVAESRRRRAEQVIRERREITFEDESRGRTVESTVYPVIGADDIVKQLLIIGRDITERRQAEDAMRQSEERLRMALSGARAGMWFWDLKENWETTPQLNVLFGRLSGSPPLRKEEYSGLIHEEDRQRVSDAWKRTVENGIPYDQEYRVVWPDGSIHWLSSKGDVVELRTGVRQFMGISFEITGRKRAEEMLGENEAQFASMFGISSVGMGIVDARTQRFLRVNRALCGITAYAEHELLAMTVDQLNHPDDREQDRRAYQNLLESGRYDVEKRYLRKNGTVVWVRVNANVIRDSQGRPMRTAAVIQDITRQKQLERELREREALAWTQKAELEFIYNSAHIGLCVLDRELRYVRINDHLAEMNGVSADLHVGKTVQEVLPPDIAGPTAKMIETVFRTGRAVLDFEISGTTHAHAGMQRQWLTHWLPLANAAGEVVSVNIVVEEITERKRAEAEREKLIGELEASNRELENFSYSVSHDLRGPVRRIAGYADMLKEEAWQNLEEPHRSYVEKISSMAKSLGDMIDALLHSSRMARRQLIKSSVDLHALATGIVEELREEVQEREILWKIAPLPRVSGDEVMLRSVLVNLIANALKFTRGRRPARIEIGCRAEQDADVVFVSDNGIGFDMVYADTLFEMFRRLHSEQEFEGTGIGLANVRCMVERHGGRVWAEGEPDAGATFSFSLPR